MKREGENSAQESVGMNNDTSDQYIFNCSENSRHRVRTLAVGQIGKKKHEMAAGWWEWYSRWYQTWDVTHKYKRRSEEFLINDRIDVEDIISIPSE